MSKLINRFRRDEHGRFIHEGLDRGRLERLTGRKVEEVRHEDLRNRDREVARNDHDRVMRSGGHASARVTTPHRETPGRETPGRETPEKGTAGREPAG